MDNGKSNKPFLAFLSKKERKIEFPFFLNILI